MSQPTNEAVERLLSKGVRNIWYGICPSSFIGADPVSLRRCGYKMVLWRDGAGKLNVLEDHCPHRGAPLSLGKPLGDRIMCGYHGVEVDRNGVAVKVPGSPGCKLEGMKATRVFPVEEHAGLVFAYIGDDQHLTPPKLELPEQLSSPEFSNFLCYAEWKGDYRYVMDNVMDPMHGAYLHRQSHSMAEGEFQAKFKIRETPTGFMFEKDGQRGVNFDWTELIENGTHWMRLEIPYPKTGGPGGNFHIVGTYAPIDDTTAAVTHWRCRKASRLAARRLAIPLQEPARGAALAGAGAGPAHAGSLRAGRARARIALQPRHGADAPAPHPEAEGDRATERRRGNGQA